MTRSFLPLKTLLGNSNDANCTSHWILIQNSGLERRGVYSLPVVSTTTLKVSVFYLWALKLFPGHALNAWVGYCPFAPSNPLSILFSLALNPGRVTWMCWISSAPLSFGCQLCSDSEDNQWGIQAGGEWDRNVYCPGFLPLEHHSSTKDHSSCRVVLFTELPFQYSCNLLLPLPVQTKHSLLLLVTGYCIVSYDFWPSVSQSWLHIRMCHQVLKEEF